MKQLIIILVMLLCATGIYAQGVGINDDGSSPNGSAILDVKSTSKGLLFPRMTDAQRDLIPSPVAGLQIYNSTQGCMNYYNGIAWVELGCDCGIATVTDIDGNVYNTVKIGEQCWMKEDLKVSHYPNGDAIPYVDDNTTWSNLANDNTSDVYCFYGDSNNDGIVDIANPDFGALYTYAAAIGDNWTRDNTANQGVCPDGWHLPTDAEWTILTDYLGGTSTAGGKLKETGITHWNFPNTSATNQIDFTALPAGLRDSYDGSFTDLGAQNYFWLATEYDAAHTWYRLLYYNASNVYRNNSSKSSGMSVRCLRD